MLSSTNFLFEVVKTYHLRKSSDIKTVTMHCVAGSDPGGDRPPKTHQSKFIHHNFVQFGKRIRDIRPFCRPLLCHSSVVKYTSSSYGSEPEMRLGYQILLKSPPNLTGWIVPVAWHKTFFC